MSSKVRIVKSTKPYWVSVEELRTKLQAAEAIVVGAGAGLSTAAGLTYSGERFERYFSDFKEKYGIEDMYSGGFYPFKTREEFWAWWSRQIYCNRYDLSPGQAYLDLLKLVQGREYFVLTTNVDHQFQLAGFDRSRLFYTQGDYGLFQCSEPCCRRTWDNETEVRLMVAQQENMKIPTELIPYCPVCGKPMTMNLRSDGKFVEDEGWHRAARSYEGFLQKYSEDKILFLELGVGWNTPGIIKYPFWQMTARNPKAEYACINFGQAYCPEAIEERSTCIDEDIAKVLKDLL